MFTIGLIVGIAIGTAFHAIFSKWGNKAKAAGKELLSDVVKEASKK